MLGLCWSWWFEILNLACIQIQGGMLFNLDYDTKFVSGSGIMIAKDTVGEQL